MKKTVLITGASSGFGLLLATTLHQRGFQVIGTSREPAKYQGKVPFQLLRLDIADADSIRTFTEQLWQQVPQLDVLVNNAGYMLTGLAEETTEAVGRQQFETNFWGTVNLTTALLPQLRKQRHGQIITVSSIVGLIGPPNLSYYSASKHALEGFFKSLRFELNQFNIQVSMIEPMYFKTNLEQNAVTGGGARVADYDAFRPKVETYAKNSMAAAPGPQAVVNTIIKVLDTRKPKFSYPVGKQAGLILFLQQYAFGMFEGSILKSVQTGK